MKTQCSLFFALATLLFSSSAFALYFDVIGPCSAKPLYQGTFKTERGESAGKVSMDIFDFHQIPYVGTEDGMNSIAGTPIGLDAIEVISDTKMRAYGWCYSVNGEIPGALPSAVVLQNANDHLVWFYAFSTYDSGEWLDYCIPAHTIKAPQFCQNTK